MKILFVTDSLGSGGAQRQLVSLALIFKKKQHNVSILIYHDLNFYKPLLEEMEIPIYCIEEDNYFRRLYKIRRFIRSFNSDSVISFLDSPNIICELSSIPTRKWKLVVSERSANPKIVKSYGMRLKRWMHVFSDFVVSNSSANIQMIRRVLPFLAPSKFKVIYNLLNLNKLAPNLKCLPKSGSLKFVILVAASHQYLKNLRGLVEAIHLIGGDNRDGLEIHWYGDVQNNTSYIEAVEQIELLNLSEFFSFFPATLEIHSAMLRADAVGLFSFYEGLPNAICEAMALGKPVVASNVSDVPELLGDVNFMCDPTNPKSIAEAILKAKDTPADVLFDIGQRNRREAVKLFDPENIYSQYIKLLL